MNRRWSVEREGDGGEGPVAPLEPYLVAIETGVLRLGSFLLNVTHQQKIQAAQLCCGVAAAIAAIMGVRGVVYLLLYLALTLAGVLGGAIFVCFPVFREVKNAKLPLLPRGVSEGAVEAATSPMQKETMDKRFTGHSQVDDEIAQFLDLAFRDYIHYWYDSISVDPTYPMELRRCVQKVVMEVSAACKQIDYVSLFTETYVDIFVRHLTLYRKAKRERETLVAKGEPSKGKRKFLRPRIHHSGASRTASNTSSDSRSASKSAAKSGPAGADDDVPTEAYPTLEELFFREDGEHRAVCTDEDAERAYCRDLAEDLFDETVTRTMLREMMASSSLKLSMDIFSDPDYMNSTIAMSISNSTFSFVDVQDAASHCTPEELEIIIENIDFDNKQRTLERGQGNDGKHHREINDLLALRGECKKLLAQRLAERAGQVAEGSSTYAFTCKSVLENSDARAAFRKYLTGARMVVFLDFLDAVDDLRMMQKFSATDISECMDEQTTSVTKKSRQVYQKFLAPNVQHRIALPDDVFDKIRGAMSSEKATIHPSVFDAARKHVDWHVSTSCFDAFKQSPEYGYCVDLLTAELTDEAQGGIDEEVGEFIQSRYPDGSMDSDSVDSDDVSESPLGDTDSIGSTAAPTFTEGGRWETALIQAAQSEAGHFIYAIQVRHTDANGDQSQWMTSRRFSEFDNLNKKLREMFPNESKRFDLDLGAKKFFGNKSQLFIRKRGEKLMRWLSIVVSSDFLQSAQGAEKVIAKFLWQGAYEKVGLKVTTRVLPKLRRRGSSDTGASGDALGDGDEDQDDHESVPVQILLKVFSEIFELRNKGYMSRSIKNITVRMLKGLFGNGLNKVVTDHINKALQPKQVAAFWKNQREVVWWPLPEEVLAPASPVRPPEYQNRTRLEARAKLFGLLPSTLKDFIGAGTARRGVSDLFEMLQSRELNRRLLYVVLEATFVKMFPTHDFEKVFKTLRQSPQQDSLGVGPAPETSE